MDVNEWEMLDTEGAFHFTFSLVPIPWHNSRPKPVRAARDEHGYVTQTWWRNHQPAISISKYFDECIICTDETPSPLDFMVNETKWIDENHHRVELWETDNDDVEHVLIHIDTRYPYVDFLASVVNFANQSNCLFYLKHEDDFVAATSIAIFEALNRSPAAALEKRRFDRPKNQ